ncbi:MULTISPECIES: hypothetical protein [unclassified Spiroplasma]|uniref:hypothetical protein n=1 Tax=unclassified Spiroplasma TaxID=2637901 RepID=UPI00313CEF16
MENLQTVISESDVPHLLQKRVSQELKIEEIASKALEWTYRLNNLCHFNLFEKVLDLDISNLKYVSNTISQIEVIESKRDKEQLLVNDGYQPLINDDSDVEKIFTLSNYNYFFKKRNTYQIIQGINLESPVEWTNLDAKFNFILEIKNPLLMTDIKVIEKPETIIVLGKYFNVPPHSTVYAHYFLWQTKATYKCNLKNMISGNISGKIHLKTGEIIDYIIPIGFGIYLLQKMEQTTINILKVENDNLIEFNTEAIITTIEGCKFKYWIL